VQVYFLELLCVNWSIGERTVVVVKPSAVLSDTARDFRGDLWGTQSSTDLDFNVLG